MTQSSDCLKLSIVVLFMIAGVHSGVVAIMVSSQYGNNKIGRRSFSGIILYNIGHIFCVVHVGNVIARH